MRAKRVPNPIRREMILKAAATLSYTQGYATVKQAEIAALAGVAPSTVVYLFKDMDRLRRALMGWAIENKDLKILAQGLSIDDSIALAAPVTLRANAVASLSA